jgi:hypothetical protein
MNSPAVKSLATHHDEYGAAGTSAVISGAGIVDAADG